MKKVLTTLYDELSSIKLTIFIFLTLASVSIIGTVVPQRAQPYIYIRDFGYKWYQFIEILGINDLYHTPFFILMLLLLGINVTLCSIKRIRTTLGVIKARRSKFHVPGDLKATLKLKKRKGEEDLVKVLRKFFFSPKREKIDGRTLIFGKKGLYSRLGVYVAHLGVIVVLIGAVLGSKLGFEGFLTIGEGEVKNSFVDTKTYSERPFDFAIKLCDFDVTFYKGTRRPKDYVSIVTIIKDGKEVKSAEIRVNHPLKFEGISFYQASYEAVKGGRKVLLFYSSKDGNDTGSVWVNLGGVFKVGDLLGEVVEIIPDYKIENGKVVSASSMFINPCCKVRFLGENSGKSIWVSMRQDPNIKNSYDGYSFSILSVLGDYYSGIQISKDPGVSLIWIGSFLVIFGVSWSLLWPYRAISIEVEKNGRVLYLSGFSERNRSSFEIEFKRIEEEILKEA